MYRKLIVLFFLISRVRNYELKWSIWLKTSIPYSWYYNHVLYDRGNYNVI